MKLKLCFSFCVSSKGFVKNKQKHLAERNIWLQNFLKAFYLRLHQHQHQHQSHELLDEKSKIVKSALNKHTLSISITSSASHKCFLNNFKLNNCMAWTWCAFFMLINKCNNKLNALTNCMMYNVQLMNMYYYMKQFTCCIMYFRYINIITTTSCILWPERWSLLLPRASRASPSPSSQFCMSSDWLQHQKFIWLIFAQHNDL